MTERIQHLMKLERLSPVDFAAKLGIDRTSISHFISGRNQPSRGFIEKVLRTFPTLNARWFILGEGEPYIEDKPSSPSLFNHSTKEKNIQEEKREEKVPVQPTKSTEKKIEQIVVLNNDGTFTQYVEKR